MAASRDDAHSPNRRRCTITGASYFKIDSSWRLLDGRKSRFSSTNQRGAGALRVAARPA